MLIVITNIYQATLLRHDEPPDSQKENEADLV